MEAPAPKPIGTFYVFDRDFTLIDGQKALIHPEIIVPFVRMINEEDSLHWAITSAGGFQLNEDPGYRALVTANGNQPFEKPPVYVEFNGTATLLRSVVAVSDEGIELDLDINAGNPSDEEKAKIVFDILSTAQLRAAAEAKKPIADEEEENLFAKTLLKRAVKAERDQTHVTYDESATITFQFGQTRVTFNLHTLLQNLSEISDGDYKLFFIFQALDAAKLNLISHTLPQLGVTKISTPIGYTEIAAKDVVFLDDKPKNCAVIAKAGFTAIQADTQAANVKNKLAADAPVDTYIEKLHATIPKSIAFRRFVDEIVDEKLVDMPSQKIEAARNQASVFLTQLFAENADPAVFVNLPKLAPLFTFKEIRFSPFQKSVDPMPPLALADAYIERGQYQRELSHFLIETLAAAWKNPEAHARLKKVGDIRRGEDADISPTLVRKAYNGKYNSEFFSNPTSDMHKKTNAAGEFNMNMEQIRAEAKKGSRTEEVLEALGARQAPAPK